MERNRKTSPVKLPDASPRRDARDPAEGMKIKSGLRAGYGYQPTYTDDGY